MLATTDLKGQRPPNGKWTIEVPDIYDSVDLYDVVIKTTELSVTFREIQHVPRHSIPDASTDKPQCYPTVQHH